MRWFGIVVLGAVVASGVSAQEKQILAVPGAVAGLPFSPAVRVGGIIYLSGQIGNRIGTREVVPGGVRAETRQALENIRTVLEAAGSSLDNVFKCTVFLADIADYAAMNEVYAGVFPAAPPARSTVAGSGLALGARVEIECLATAGPAR
jgi:reactive intermediate/imine deaminase